MPTAPKKESHPSDAYKRTLIPHHHELCDAANVLCDNTTENSKTDAHNIAQLQKLPLQSQPDAILLSTECAEYQTPVTTPSTVVVQGRTTSKLVQQDEASP
ncbi:hypothetical protein PHISCL_04327 [Aspergillus sclerotialis]|uniref:Uncharacterized protein n=1 Tax=Aspergillus sclerotialis TaxID=2070753 RepID=A0A3A3A1Y6_9EURO|nr:hypothetical protein PHISCL_04327 [Aspergillus sclerotialis]